MCKLFKKLNWETALFIIIVITIIFMLMQESFKSRRVNTRRVVTLHHVDWCPHCKLMMPIWKKLKKEMTNIEFRENDEDKNKTPGVNSYPTIRMVDEHGHVYEYHGGPDYVSLYNWLVSPH